jgi:hypothetical protein
MDCRWVLFKAKWQAFDNLLNERQMLPEIQPTSRRQLSLSTAKPSKIINSLQFFALTALKFFVIIINRRRQWKFKTNPGLHTCIPSYRPQRALKKSGATVPLIYIFRNSRKAWENIPLKRSVANLYDTTRRRNLHIEKYLVWKKKPRRRPRPLLPLSVSGPWGLNMPCWNS